MGLTNAWIQLYQIRQVLPIESAPLAQLAPVLSNEASEIVQDGMNSIDNRFDESLRHSFSFHAISRCSSSSRQIVSEEKAEGI